MPPARQARRAARPRPCGRIGSAPPVRRRASPRGRPPERTVRSRR